MKNDNPQTEIRLAVLEKITQHIYKTLSIKVRVLFWLHYIITFSFPLFLWYLVGWQVGLISLSGQIASIVLANVRLVVWIDKIYEDFEQ